MALAQSRYDNNGYSHSIDRGNSDFFRSFLLLVKSFQLSGFGRQLTCTPDKIREIQGPELDNDLFDFVKSFLDIESILIVQNTYSNDSGVYIRDDSIPYNNVINDDHFCLGKLVD